MFSRSFIASAVALLAAVSQVQAHAYISPGLGVSGTGVRNDVQRPSTGSPCGSANLAAIDSSTAAVATNGLFNAVATNFNAGTDGATALKSATVDTTGTGKSFKGQVTIVKNGVANPPAVAPANLQLQLPAGTVCTGGKDKNRCLVSVVTNAGFGNCLVVSTGAAKPAAAAGAAASVVKTTSAAVKATSVAAAAVKTTTAPAVACTTPATTGAIGKGAAAVAVPPPAAAPATGAATGAKHQGHHHHNKSNKSRDDSRNARTLVESMRRNVQAVRRLVGGAQA